MRIAREITRCAMVGRSRPDWLPGARATGPLSLGA